jgi:hypothetical protein
MQRVVVVLMVLSVAQVAHADLELDVERLVHANLKAVAAGKLADFDRTVTGGSVLVLPNGKTSIESKLVADIYGPKAKKVAHKVDSLHVVVDVAKKLAWFHGAFTATFVVDKQKIKRPMRISGIAADEGEPSGWKIQALMYARTMPDRELATHVMEATRGAAKTSGDAAIAKLVSAWFGDGGSIANDRSKNVAVEVNGTGAAEIGNGAFALRLVKLWESAKLWATSVEATPFANNEIAFVRADVMLPVDKQAAKLVLGVVMVKENNVWRWVTLSFSPAAES